MTPSTALSGTPAPATPLKISKKMLKALAPLPATAMQLMALLDDPHVPLQRVAEVAARDVGIAASILRMANSPIFGMRNRVGSIVDAIRVIGTVQARLLVLACGIAQAGQKELPIYGLAAGAFLRHSELVAMLTASVARQAGYTPVGMAYSAGLLHDIGKVVLNELAQQQALGGQRSQQFTAALQAPGASIITVERTFFGTDHAAVGHDLVTLWALPADFGGAIWAHHDDSSADPDEPSLAACLVLANAVACDSDSNYPAGNRVPLPSQPLLPVKQVVALATELLQEKGSLLERS